MTIKKYAQNIVCIANPLVMNGKKLKEIIWESGIKIKTISKDSGIPEQTLYSLYRKEKVEDYYIKKLALTGLGKHLPKNIVPEASAITEDESTAPHFESMFSLLEQMAHSVLQDNDLYRRIIIKGLEKDAILFNTAKAGVTKREFEGKP